MNRRRVMQVGAATWAVIALAVALPSVAMASTDARVLVGAASVLGPLAAATAAVVLRRGGDRWAGALLLVSVVTPTYFVWVVNLPALVAGVVLVVAPAVVVGLRGEMGTRQSRIA
jgi:hypothetical protein